MSQDYDRSGKIDLSFLTKFSFVDILVYPLACLDFMTTSYGIFVQALAFQGFPAIIASVILAGIFLWVVLISKDKAAPAIKEKIATPFRELSSKVQQGKWVEFIANAIAPTIVFSIGIAYAIVDFWTSLEGVNAVIPFKGFLGLVLKGCLVFALVFSTLYLIYLQPKKAEENK